MCKMPVLFVGHGSPMNAIENNSFTKEWVEIAAKIPKPSAILSVSAHWTTNGTSITDHLHPKTIYDMYGFSKELYEVKYQPPGAPELAHAVHKLIDHCQIDNSWGIDHGTWTVLNWMYPKADVPVVQLSLNWDESRQYHYELGGELKSLREAGILILGSGNVVHNLARANWRMTGGYDWAVAFDQYIQDKVISREYQDIIHYEKAGAPAKSAFLTTEHFDPLLYVLGAADPDEHLLIYNNSCTMGSVSMTCYLIG